MLRRSRSFLIAARGIASVARSEFNFRLQLLAAVAVTAAGAYFQIDASEWIAQSICIGLVLAFECMNTAIEKLSDVVQPENDPAIEFIKDAAAGAVLIAALTSVVTASLIYVPRVFSLSSAITP